MKYFGTFIIAISFASGVLWAQESVMTSFMDDPAIHGTALSGSAFTHNISADISSMWTDVDGGLQFGSLHAQDRTHTGKFGYGILAAYTNFGLYTGKEASLAGNYKLPVSAGSIYVGINAGMQDLSVSFSTADPTQTGDPLLASDMHTQIMHAGLSCSWENTQGYFSITVPDIWMHANDAAYPLPGTTTYINGAYTIPITTRWDIMPALDYTVHADMPGQLALQLRCTWDKKVFADAGYRTDTFYILGIGYAPNNAFTFSYHYHITTGALGQVAGGSHALFLGYRFGDKKRKKYFLFVNCLYIPQAPETGEFELPAVEMHHALHVLRLRIGDAFAFTNGKGRTGTAELIYADKKRSTAKMLSVLDHAPVLPVIHLAVSLLKTRDRFDFLLEKCTEIGVTDIYLLRTQNAERRDMAAEKAEQVLIAAIKQSHRPFLPKLHAVMTAEDLFVESRNFKGQKFICHCRDTALPYVTTSYDPGTPVLIMIGPEGDFSKEEIAAAEENDFRSVKLSETVLRSETAAMSAVLFLHAIYQNTK